ncbi:hypothetical protein GCM10011386_14520 [Parapedobacter defluvii]|uniref:SusD/RagB family nutrient-binding outer membrane lipoprotein n=1 Tax=Parapedobacter defluvii TaxID=2045106 RepID=A0ABQ1LHX4_9SPHI|nr:SusD/RagB family nutrient-binding outer membrane lipoprotein [Parapedobacter defluvii]GGC23671.1 hypothetical protein GCM10011386_14520 [Parapedobacter defluvii]
MKALFINKLSYLIVLTVALLGNAGCTSEFDSFNSNKTQIMDVAEKELAGLFSRAQIHGVAWLSGDQYGRATRNWANPLSGYFVTSGFSSEQLVINYDHITTVQNAFFGRSIPAAVVIQEKSKETNPVAYHVATIWKAYVMYQLADVWGPLPYTEAGSGKSTVAYESVEAIYDHIFQELAAAVTYLTPEVQANPALNVFGAGDIIYEGDVSKWIKFANTMRLRLAMRVSNIDAARAKQEAEAAAQGATMDSNDDNAWIVDIPSFNGLENGMVRNRTSMLMSADIESYMKGFADPRMPVYFSPVTAAPIPGTPPEILANIGGFHGLMPGYAASDEAYIRMYSPVGPQWGPNVVSTTVPMPVKFAAETYFLKAEGAWRGWNMGAPAKELYEKGIELSLRQWIPDISQAAIDAYTNGGSLPVDPQSFPYTDGALSDTPVKFAQGAERQYEQIITQKWLALYPDAWEAWAEHRRTRLPKLYKRRQTLNTDINLAKGQLMTRMVYPESEKISQPEEMQHAVELLGGPDRYSTPIWWDIHPNGN